MKPRTIATVKDCIPLALHILEIWVGILACVYAFALAVTQ